MNDLTPNEHSDLRDRLIAGARSIRPAGAHRRAWTAGTLAVVLVAGLSATAIGASSLLSASDPDPMTSVSPSPSPSLTPSISPTPMSTPTADDPASVPPARSDVSEWVIGFDGIGPFAIRGSIEGGWGSAVPPYEPATGECPNPDMSILRNASAPTLWIEGEAGAPDVIRYVAVGGDVSDPVLIAGSPRTESGVGVGATLDAVLDAYPGGSLERDLEGAPDRLVVSGTDSTGATSFLVFDFFDDSVQTVLVQTDEESIVEFCG